MRKKKHTKAKDLYFYRGSKRSSGWKNWKDATDNKETHRCRRGRGLEITRQYETAV